MTINHCCMREELLKILPMAAFDFVESASTGYRFLWDERFMIARWAAIPFAIKFISFMFVISFDLEENFLRQGLILLPSYFAEGWLLAHLMRMAMFTESWPGSLKKDSDGAQALMQDRSRDVMGAAIIYVLIKLVLSFLSGVTMEAQAHQAPEPQDSGLAMLLVGFAIVVFLIWAFRFLWLYVPVALNYNIRAYLKRIKSFMTSVYMIGLWFLCFIPFVLILVLCSEILLVVFPPEGDMPSTPYKYAMTAVQSVVEMAIAIVSSVGMAYGIHTMMTGHNKPTSLL